MPAFVTSRAANWSRSSSYLGTLRFRLGSVTALRNYATRQRQARPRERLNAVMVSQMPTSGPCCSTYGVARHPLLTGGQRDDAGFQLPQTDESLLVPGPMLARCCFRSASSRLHFNDFACKGPIPAC